MFTESEIKPHLDAPCARLTENVVSVSKATEINSLRRVALVTQVATPQRNPQLAVAADRNTRQGRPEVDQRVAVGARCFTERSLEINDGESTNVAGNFVDLYVRTIIYKPIIQA